MQYFSVVMPFFAAAKGFHLKHFLHFRTQRVKGPADCHLTVAMRFITKYLNEKSLNVITSSRFVVAFNYGVCLTKTTSDLVEINLSFGNFQKW